MHRHLDSSGRCSCKSSDMYSIFKVIAGVCLLRSDVLARKDHGLRNLKSFIKHLHEEYDKPISTQVQLLSDDAFKQKDDMKRLVESYDIE